MLRLFVGIELPEAVRQALAEVREAHPAARWHEPEQLHLTLSFIGPVEQEAARNIAQVLAGVPGPSFELAVEGVGYFGSPERPRIFWAGVAESPPLYRLQQRVEARLLPLGLRLDERPYTPHITLARVRQGLPLQALLQRHASLSLPAFTVDHICLFLSGGAEQGVRYEVLERFQLV